MSAKKFLIVITTLFVPIFLFQSQTISGDETASGKVVRNISQPVGDRVSFEEFFIPKTMRVDLFHTVSYSGESVGLDEIVMEHLWSGTRKNLVTPFNYGKYRFRVVDAESGKLIYSRGFCTLAGEYQTTQEARDVPRTMGESLRFPYPKQDVVVYLDLRGRDGKFRKIFSVKINPSSPSILKERPFREFKVVDIAVHGGCENQVDFLILPEGYTRAQVEKMRRDAERFTQVLFETEPFRSYRDKISVRMVEAFSRQSGSDEPRKGIFVDTLFDTSFNTFSAPRYLTTMNNKVVREVASLAPNDLVLIMVNTARYGGGGIYNFWDIFPADNEYSEYIFIHELGHAFAGLGDEYYQEGAGYDENEFYPEGVEPWEPNLTAFIDRKIENVKWKNMIAKGIPVPTPNKKRYAGVIGVFEGGGYKSKGIFRPSFDCKMFHKGRIGFCDVCKDAIVRMIRYLTN